MQDSMVGSHVNRSPRSSSRHQNADTVSFSSSRASSRARRGELGTLAPSTTSGESDAAYRQRIRQSRQIEEYQRRASRRRVIVGVLAVLVVLAAAIGAGYLAFKSTIGTELTLENSNATEALVAPKENEPYYVLITADLGAIAQPLGHEGPNVVMLARVDNEAHQLAFINIPSELQVSYGDGEVRHLYEMADAGDSGIINAVAKFAGVDIAHFVKIDKANFVNLVDAFNGVEVDVPQVIDDPHAGDLYIASGTQVLNGETALVYLRAENLAQGIQDKMDNQLDFLKRIMLMLFSNSGGLDFASGVERMSSFVQTDLAFSDFSSVNEWLAGASGNEIVCTKLPGYFNATSGVVKGEETYYIASSKTMGSLIESLEAGEDPESESQAKAESVEASGISVEVQNGTDIVGAASVTADVLRQNGFKVEKVGNAEQQIYTETLVVYKGDDGEARAQAVISALGIGRAVSASYYYEFEDDILVILGSDYKPVAQGSVGCRIPRAFPRNVAAAQPEARGAKLRNDVQVVSDMLALWRYVRLKGADHVLSEMRKQTTGRRGVLLRMWR